MRTLSVGTQEISENVYSLNTTKSVHSYITSDHTIRNKSKGHKKKKKQTNKQTNKQTEGAQRSPIASEGGKEHKASCCY